MDLALLDTDTVSEILKQKNPRVTDSAAAYLQQHGEFAFSSITRFELLRGLKEKNATAQLARFLQFCRQSLISAVSDAVFDRAAELWVVARRGGQPGNDADLIVAATALELQRVLVKGNRRHFAWIPGLQLEDWRTR
jgi:tRNA(fMet)-specific endonuclease VapC